MTRPAAAALQVPADRPLPSWSLPVSAEQIAAADAVVRPGRLVPSLGALETRALTDRERLEALASIHWYAMHGGC